MSKVAFILTGSALLIISCPAALSQVPAVAQSAPATVLDQGRIMIQQGDEMIRQGQVLRETGQKMIQQPGAATTPATQTAVPSIVPPAAGSPAPASPAAPLQNIQQYQEYIQQGQDMLKNPKKMIPGMK